MYTKKNDKEIQISYKKFNIIKEIQLRMTTYMQVQEILG